jgi:hypothetical protein
MSNVQIDFKREGGGAGGTTKTDSSGAYTVTLLPGTYTAALHTSRPIMGGNRVTVSAGQVTTADFAVDSGIR